MKEILRIRPVSLLVAAALALGPGTTALAADEPDPRPSFVLILTDDQDLSTIEFMPHVRELLIERGASFSNAFVAITACCPSRVSTLRGQYSHNHGVLLNGGEGGGFPMFESTGGEDSTIATWLENAGYSTLLAGKYLNRYKRPSHVPPGWSRWYGITKYSYSDYRISDNGAEAQFGEGQKPYLTDALADRVVRFIGRAERSRPLFIYYAPWAPHKPATPAPRHAESHSELKAPRGPAFNEADVSDKPGYVRKRSPLTENEIARLDNLYRKRVRSLLAVDESVERIVEALDSSGRLDNTFVLYTTDSGFHLGDHRLYAGKGGPYDENIRVPLIVRGPGVAPGTDIDRLAVNIDLAPTLAEWAGVEVPSFVDGRSLAPLLHGSPPAVWRRSLLIEHWGKGKRFRSLRAVDRMYAEYEEGERELYDLRKDPHQLENIHDRADPGYVKALATILERLAGCAGDACREAEEIPLPPLTDY